MMNGLVDGAGKLRTDSGGVINEQGKVLHFAPPYDMVKGLMEQLFDWLKTSKTQMLIHSSIFHYKSNHFILFMLGVIKKPYRNLQGMRATTKVISAIQSRR